MRYTYVKQHDDTDCAAACLAMICLHYKKKTTISKLTDMVGMDLKGANTSTLERCAAALGFSTRAVRVGKEGFKGRYTFPAIANVITKEGISHFVVIFKMTGKYVVVGDPAKELMRMEIDDFYKIFTGILLTLKPTKKFESQKSKSNKVFDRYIRVLLLQKRLLLYGILVSILMTIFGIASSLIYEKIYDEILPHKQENVTNMVIMIFLGISVIGAVAKFTRQWVFLRASICLHVPLALEYLKHVYKLPMKFFETRQTGNITTHFSDIERLKQAVTDIGFGLVIDIGVTIIMGVVMLCRNPKLFAVVAMVLVISIIIALTFKLTHRNVNEEQLEQKTVLHSHLIDGLSSIETIKSTAYEDVDLENIEKEYVRLACTNYRSEMLSNIKETLFSFISGVGNLLIIYMGVRQVTAGDMTLGGLMAFITLLVYFMSPVKRLADFSLSFKSEDVSAKHILEMFEYDVEKADSEEKARQPIKSIDGNIVIKNVTYRYGTRKPTLKNISFTIPKGKKVGVVGGSGCGKSTIAKLLLKYYEPENGEITINGVNIDEYSNTSLRKAISYVPENIELFSRNIYDNIRITRMDATLDEVKEVSNLVGANDFINKLPMKYYTYLGKGGAGLSGGERQKIALARAFLKDSNIYILDESTSNLDFANENMIFDMIYNKYKDKTMMIIAHRLATVKNCDSIVVMSEGKIVEQGTHEELMRKKGKYYRLWEMQQVDLRC